MFIQDEIHGLARSKDVDERKTAIDELKANFSQVPNKKQAWQDLYRLVHDVDSGIRVRAVHALCFAVPHISDKENAWCDLIRLLQCKDSRVLWGLTKVLSIAFVHFRNETSAEDDLYSLQYHENPQVRWGVSEIYGAIFARLSDNDKYWTERIILGLTQDKWRYVRASAYHSLGKIAIHKATKAENDNIFRKEMEIALGYFEASSKETPFFNHAQFCLPFYRSFYAITFKKPEDQNKVQKYFAEAKNAVEGSESKKQLLEVISNLANALKEAQKTQQMNLNDKKIELKAYRRYCERAVELLDATEGNAPGATKLIRKGLPIIDERIKGIIAEIQEKAKALCKQVKDSEYKEIGQQVNNVGQELSKVIDTIRLEKEISNMLIPLSAMCKKMPEEDRGEACELLEKIKQEQYVEDKRASLPMQPQMPHEIRVFNHYHPPQRCTFDSSLSTQLYLNML